MSIDWSAAAELPYDDRILFAPFPEPESEPGTSPAVTGPLDLGPVRARLAPYEAQLEAMRAEAEEIKVNDEASAARATDLGVTLRKIEKTVDEARAYFKRPALDFGKSIDALAAAYIDKAKAAAGTLGRKVGQYQAQKKKEELERLRREQEAAAALQKKVEQEAAAAGVEAPPPVVIPKSLPASAPIRTAAGKAIMSERWVCRIIDENLVPREYCAPVQSLLNAAVKAGLREIPGCEIKQEASARFGA